MTLRLRPATRDCHASLTAAWTIGCLLLIAALAVTVALVMESY